MRKAQGEKKDKRKQPGGNIDPAGRAAREDPQGIEKSQRNQIHHHHIFDGGGIEDVDDSVTEQDQVIFEGQMNGHPCRGEQ